jgi:uncharacterized DUF497 family protein
MRTSVQLTSDQFSEAVTTQVAKDYPGINLQVHGVSIAEGGVVTVDVEVLARQKKARQARKPRAAKVSVANGSHAGA